jgi:hypothetical protein
MEFRIADTFTDSLARLTGTSSKQRRRRGFIFNSILRIQA